MSRYDGSVCLHEQRRTRGDRLSYFAAEYPGSSAGFALLLLRVALGLTAFYRGWHAFVAWHGNAVTFELIETFLLLAGTAVIAGIWTRVASMLLFLVLAGDMLRAAPDARNFDQLLSTLLSGSIALGLTLLGPGAFSIDGRRFGRREIVIVPGHRK